MILEELYVYIFLKEQGWIPCGFVTHKDLGRHSSSAFVYSNKYLQSANPICLDVHQLPLSKGQKQTADGHIIFNGLRDASPDAWGRYVMGKKFPHIALGELHYLAATNPDRVGALAFGPDSTGGPKKWTPSGWVDYEMKYLDLQTNAQGIDDLIKGERDTEAYENVVRHATGSGGARPKANVIWGNKLHLAKFSISTDPYNIPALEYATMTLAKECGLEIPNIHLSRALDRDVFLIERFDRDKHLNPSHFISGLTLTNIAENEYQRFSYRELCESIVRYSSDFKRDLLKLYKRVAFNIMVNNNDDHLRNYGFLPEDNSWRLSPHYDVVPAKNTTQGGFALSLKLEGGSEASRENLIMSRELFRLSKQDACDIFDEMQKIVSDNWQQVFSNSGLSEETISLFSFSFIEKG